MDIKLEYGHAYLKSHYASAKNVTPSRITHLIAENKLEIKRVGNKDMIVHCLNNDKQFENASHNRGKKIA